MIDREQFRQATTEEKMEMLKAHREARKAERLANQTNIPVVENDGVYELDGTLKVKEIIVASDFQVASPPFPKTKDEAKKILQKYKNTKKGEPKSIAEALQAIMKIVE